MENFTVINAAKFLILLTLLFALGCDNGSSSNVTTGDTGGKPPGPDDPCPSPLGVEIQVYINEVMVDNTSAVPNGSGEFYPWVEFYNPGPDSMELGGAYFSDSIADNQRWQFPCQFPETNLQAGEFLVMFFGGDGNPDDLHIDFLPEISGEHIYVLNQSSDFFYFNADLLDQNQSTGPFPDGGGDAVPLSVPTPGGPNAEPIPPVVFVRGDLDLDLDVDEDDLALLTGHFSGSPVITLCADRLDINDNGEVTISDLSYLIQALEPNGPVIPEPFPSEGVDPTPDNIDCEGP
ncbi:MAG: hypothetical protein GWP39_03855 [Planctomycetia bacterium]|jgi:hypothetical protein|nr:hypothetical protein [Planctomycetia bacterium]NCG13325.1 hypothetical protein [Planctomycetia bacterium]NCG56691.1 hypothetical protein [Pseudomonadota bacterium]